MTNENITDKIYKLLTLANRAGTEGEANAAIHKAQVLMRRHSISEATALGARPIDRENVETQTVEFKRQVGRNEKLYLLKPITAALNCDYYLYGQHVCIVGFPADIALVKTFWASIMIQCDAACATALQNRAERVHGTSFKKSFFSGFAVRFRERMDEMNEAVSAEVASTGSALVLRDKATAVADEMATLRLGTRRAARQSRPSGAGRSAGRAAASNADLGGSGSGVTTGAGGRLLS